MTHQFGNCHAFPARIGLTGGARMARERARIDRALRPTLEGGRPAWQLESRLLLSRLDQQGLPKSPRPFVQTGVANGGTAAVMIDTDGELYVGHLTGGGTVRAK